MATKRKVKLDTRQTDWASLNDLRQQSVAARENLLTYIHQQNPAHAPLVAGYYHRMVRLGDAQISPTQAESAAIDQVNRDEEARRLSEIVQVTTAAYIARLG
ncbi:MAG: hypothetical protein HY326_05945 [Chloroflexi bacterium]|nr:hypothetical protein [Chloroflexota bacterium]